jgi:hypothetical protein
MRKAARRPQIAGPLFLQSLLLFLLVILEGDLLLPLQLLLSWLLLFWLSSRRDLLLSMFLFSSYQENSQATPVSPNCC